MRITCLPSRFQTVICIILFHQALICLGGAEAEPEPSVGHMFGYDSIQVQIHEGDPFDQIEYRGAIADHGHDLLGYPELPVFTYRILLPPETRLEDLSISLTETQTLEGEYLPQPIQPEHLPGEEQEPYGPLPEVYESPEPYPTRPIEVTTEGEFRGYHLMTVKVYPLQFTGSTGELRVIERMQVNVALRPMTEKELEGLHRRERVDTRPFDQREDLEWILSTVLNPEDLWVCSPRPEDPLGPLGLSVPEDNPFGGFVPTQRPSLEGPPVRYVIITDSLDVSGHELGGGLIHEFQRLAHWKTEKGVPAVVKSVTWIEDNYGGIDTPERIREFIKDASAKWGTDYVLLGGAEDIVPFRILGAPGSEELIIDSQFMRPDPPADWYYAELDEDWNDDGDAYFGEYEDNDPNDYDEVGLAAYQDINIGRLTVRDSLEAFIVVDKILEYECHPDEDYPNVALQRHVFAV